MDLQVLTPSIPSTLSFPQAGVQTASPRCVLLLRVICLWALWNLQQLTAKGAV